MFALTNKQSAISTVSRNIVEEIPLKARLWFPSAIRTDGSPPCRVSTCISNAMVMVECIVAKRCIAIRIADQKNIRRFEASGLFSKGRY